MGLINKIKKYGFKTIRFQILYTNLTDIINSEWLIRTKEIVNWIIKNEMYCILCVYHDKEFWISGNDFINLLDQPQRVKEYEDKLFEVPCDRYWGNDPDEEWDEYPVCSFDDECSDEDDYWDEEDDWDEEEYTEVKE